MCKPQEFAQPVSYFATPAPQQRSAAAPATNAQPSPTNEALVLIARRVYSNGNVSELWDFAGRAKKSSSKAAAQSVSRQAAAKNTSKPKEAPEYMPVKPYYNEP